MTVLPLLAKYV